MLGECGGAGGRRRDIAQLYSPSHTILAKNVMTAQSSGLSLLLNVGVVLPPIALCIRAYETYDMVTRSKTS